MTLIASLGGEDTIGVRPCRPVRRFRTTVPKPMIKTFMGKAVRRHSARAKLGVKLAYDTRPKPKHRPKAASLPGPLFDLSVIGLFAIGLATYLLGAR